MASIYDRIASGGTGVASPIQKYMNVRQMAGQERGRALTEQVGQMQLEQGRQKMLTDKQDRDIKTAATVMQGVTEQDYQQRRQLLQTKYGIPSPESYDPQRLAGLAKLAGISPPKGSQINVLIKGREKEGIVPNATVNAQGQIVDSVTRQVIPGAYKAPSQTETSDVGAGGFATKGGTAKDQLKAVDMRENVYQLDSAVKGIKQKLLNSPDYVGGTAGTLVNWINSGVQEFKQVRGMTDNLIKDGKISRDKMGNITKGNMGWLRKAAFETGTADSAILELAFTHAKYLNNSGKISDADIKYAREIIESPDKAQAVAKLDDLLGRAKSNYKNARRAREGLPTYKDWQELSFPGDAPMANAQQEAESMADKLLNEALP